MIDFERLEVYKYALEFVRHTIPLRETVSKGNGELTDQFRRASFSVVLNIAEGAGTAGAHYADRASLLAALPELLHEGDVVLVKASHGAHFEEISEAVKQLS